MINDAVLIPTAYHEAGHGAAVERRKCKARIALTQHGKWNPATDAVPPFPIKSPDSAEIAVAGPIAELLFQGNAEEPDRITLPIWVDSPENVGRWFQFGEAIVANGFHRARERVLLRVQMQDKEWHRVWVSAEEYGHIPDEYKPEDIAATVKRVAEQVQDDWKVVHHIATLLVKYKKYETGSFADFVASS